MQVDVIFSNARVYRVKKMDVVLGQKFSLVTNNAAPIRWFFNNDIVLSLTETTNGADVEATSFGESTLLMIDESFNLLGVVIINVVNEIGTGKAVDLGLTADEPVTKTAQ